MQCGRTPELGRSPGEGNGYPLQYSGLENSMDCIVHGVAKSRTPLSDFHFRLFCEVSVSMRNKIGSNMKKANELCLGGDAAQGPANGWKVTGRHPRSTYRRVTANPHQRVARERPQFRVSFAGHWLFSSLELQVHKHAHLCYSRPAYFHCAPLKLRSPNSVSVLVWKE